VEPKFWRTFLGAIGRLDLEAERFAVGARGAGVRSEIQAVIGARPADHWDAVFTPLDVCYAPVLTAAEAVRHPQFLAREMVRTHADGAASPGLPISFSAAPRRPPGEVPLPGEGNEELLGRP
jgi:alpha-methylacyl-CoA racemase